MSKLTTREPVALIGTVTSIVGAVLALVVSFGLDLTDAQQAAILAVAVVAAPLVAAVLARRKVTPVG